MNWYKILKRQRTSPIKLREIMVFYRRSRLGGTRFSCPHLLFLVRVSLFSSLYPAPLPLSLSPPPPHSSCLRWDTWTCEPSGPYDWCLHVGGTRPPDSTNFILLCTLTNFGHKRKLSLVPLSFPFNPCRFLKRQKEGYRRVPFDKMYCCTSC